MGQCYHANHSHSFVRSRHKSMVHWIGNQGEKLKIRFNYWRRNSVREWFHCCKLLWGMTFISGREKTYNFNKGSERFSGRFQDFWWLLSRCIILFTLTVLLGRCSFTLAHQGKANSEKKKVSLLIFLNLKFTVTKKYSELKIR